MDKYGNLYIDENPPEEDLRREEEWGKEIEKEEIQKKLKELEKIRG